LTKLVFYGSIMLILLHILEEISMFYSKTLALVIDSNRPQVQILNLESVLEYFRNAGATIYRSGDIAPTWLTKANESFFDESKGIFNKTFYFNSVAILFGDEKDFDLRFVRSADIVWDKAIVDKFLTFTPKVAIRYTGGFEKGIHNFAEETLNTIRILSKKILPEIIKIELEDEVVNLPVPSYLELYTEDHYTTIASQAMFKYEARQVLADLVEAGNKILEN
jgi:hypothetical protein